MSGIQTATIFPMVGWDTQPDPFVEKSLGEKISQVVAFAFLWITSFFSLTNQLLLNVYYSDQEALVWERRGPGPIHSRLESIREDLFHLLDLSEENFLEANNNAAVLVWDDHSTIRRSGFDPSRVLAVDDRLRRSLYEEALFFRKAIRAHVESFSSVVRGIESNHSIQRHKQALRSALESLDSSLGFSIVS